MKIAIIYNKDMSGVINQFGMQNKEIYSPRTVQKVAAALEKGGHNVEIIDGNMNVVESIQTFLPQTRAAEKMGMVFNMAYGIQGESRYTHIPAMLEMLGIPYVGSSPSGHALALDKVIAKIIMQKHTIPTPDFWVFSTHEEDMSDVEYPVIVKPKMESVSFGLKVVDNEYDLRHAVEFIIGEFKQQALVEQFIRGREFCVGLIGNEPLEAFPVLEIDFHNNYDAVHSVYDKQDASRGRICPADISEELAKEMTALSISAFKALQLRDFSRVDIRLDESNNIYVLEINSMASIEGSATYPCAASVAGYDYMALMNKMVDVAATRYFFNIQSHEPPSDNKKIPLHIRIRSYLRSRQEIAESLLKKITDINTYVRNVDGVNQVSNILKREFSQLKFSFEVIPHVEVGHFLFFTNTDRQDYDIMFIGNLDNNVKINEHNYFHKTDQKLFGTGVWEHKGGLIVVLMALQALRYARLLGKTKLGILLTSDNTIQGKFAKELVGNKAMKANYVFGLHGAFLNGALVTSRSGAARYNCTMNLRRKDDAKYVAMACGAFSKLLSSWTDLSDAESGLIVSPSDVTLHSNITEPHAYASANLSVRFNDKSQIQSVDQKIRKSVPAKMKDIIHLQVKEGIRRPPMLHNDKVEHLFLEAKKNAEMLDIILNQEHRWSSANICFVDESKYMIDGMGPMGSKSETAPEFVLRHSLLERASLLALMINELGKK